MKPVEAGLKGASTHANRIHFHSLLVDIRAMRPVEAGLKGASTHANRIQEANKT